MTEKETFYHLAWAHGEVTVRAVGGMIAPVEFDLGGGRRISPLHVAPWKPEGLSPLMAGPLARYAAIRAETVADAIATLIGRPSAGRHVHENAELKELARPRA